MKIKYKSTSGITKIINLKDKDKDGDHWHINEEPFVVYEHEIKNGKFNSPLHNEALKASKEIPKRLNQLRRRLWWDELLRKIGLISLLFVMIGCGITSETERKIYDAAMLAPLNYKCSEEQTKNVRIETKFCIETLEYKKAICYGLSIIKYCNKIKKDK